MDERIKAIRASVIDGIACTPRYRERQLASLHESLLALREQLIGLLTQETSLSQEEATVQFLLTAKATKCFHESVHPKKCMDDEYLIAQGKDHKSRRSPYGYAYIVPSQHDILYSCVVPTAAAIAAGNCVVLELQQTVSELSAKLKSLLLKALSVQTFAVTSQDPFNESFRSKFGIYMIGSQVSEAMTTTHQIQTDASRVAALVDRSANIKTAAAECVDARFAFGGLSAYAPDVVLVNEFSVQEFCSAAAQSGLRYLSGNASGKPSNASTATKRPGGLENGLLKKLQKSAAETLVSGDRGTIALLKSRDSDLLLGKLDAPLLLIVPITSMDDAIDYLVNQIRPLRAAYLFSAPEAAKYLGQFISSSITTVNHIPLDLLVGSPAPYGHPTSIQPRYTTEIFSVAQPEIIEPSDLANSMGLIISRDASTKEKRKAESSLNLSLDRVKEAFGPPLGFFEQGILFGLSCVLVTTITVGVVAVRYSGPVLMSTLRIW